MSTTTSSTPERRSRTGRLATILGLLVVCVAALALVPSALAAKPAEVSQPTIEGTLRQGQAIAAGTGIWANTPTGYTYQWVRCNAQGLACFAVSGQTASTYFLSADDVGNTIQVLVTATNSDGSTTANSKLSAIVSANVLPAATAAPAVTGTAEVGQQLTASTGTWTGGPTITVRWQRCNAAGKSCADVAGATGTSYGVLAADAGSTIVAVATGRNLLGAADSVSAPTAVVAAVNSAKPKDAVTLPSGETSVAVTSVSLPQRLLVSGVSVTPAAIASASAPVTVKVRVTDTRGYAVSGATVTLAVLPAAWGKAGASQSTAADGWATFTLTPSAALPLKRGTVLTLFALATKAGDKAQAGVSAYRLISVRVRPAA